MEDSGSRCCVDGWNFKLWDRTGIPCLLPAAGSSRAPRGYFWGVPQAHPVLSQTVKGPGSRREGAGPAAGPRSLGPVPVLQSQGSHFPGESRPGNALGTSGRGGSLLKNPAGPAGWVQGKERAATSAPDAREATAATDGPSGTPGRMQVGIPREFPFPPGWGTRPRHPRAGCLTGNSPGMWKFLESLGSSVSVRGGGTRRDHRGGPG